MDAPHPLPQPSTVGWRHVRCPKCGAALTVSESPEPLSISCSACGEALSLHDAATCASAETVDATSSAGPNDATDRILPDFDILEILGEGGMGIVYRARDRKLGRTVAVKMIRASRIADPEDRGRMVDRFRREAEAVARLQHPNIVQIFSVGEIEQGPYFAMEHVEGGTLASAVRGSSAEPRVAATIACTLAHAIEAAHRQGIIHRDLKPGNILLHHPSGIAGGLAHAVPKIADFGLAKEADPSRDHGQTMGIVGTPSYMAPEQAQERGTKVGPAADVYAIGAILYDLVTGRPPFKGASVLDTLEQVRTQEPVPPSRLQPGMPRDLEVICLKCLRKEPGARYRSAEALAQDLERFLDGRPIQARATGFFERTWKWSRRHPARAAVVALSMFAILGAFSAILWDRERVRSHAKDLEAENKKTETARQLAKNNADLALKEAGEKELQRKDAVEKSVRLRVGAGLKLQDEGDGLTALLHFAEAAALDDPASPNGWMHEARFAAAIENSPQIVHTWSHEGGVSRVAFSPDGRRMLSTSSDGTIALRDSGTGKPLHDAPLKHTAAVNDACFSFDGKRILSGSDDKTARVWETETGKPLGTALHHLQPVLQVAFRPNSEGGMLTVEGNRNALATQREGPRAMVPQRIVTGVGPNGVPMFTTIMVPGPSTGVVRREPRGHVALWDGPDSAKPSQSLPALGWINHAAFSVDGSAVATANSSLEKVNSIALWPLPMKEKPPFVKLQNLVLHVDLSPSGKQIAAAGGSLEKGIGEAVLFDAATQAAIGQPMRHRGLVEMVRFSPDGRRVATASHDGTARIWDAATGDPITEPLRHRDRVVGAWFDADGRRLLTASSDGSVCLWNTVTGEALTPILRHGAAVAHAALHPDGSRVIVGCVDGIVRVWNLAPHASTRPTLKTQDVLPPPPNYAIESHLGNKSHKISLLPARVATGAVSIPQSDRLLIGAGQKFREFVPGNPQGGLTGYRTTHLLLWNPQTGEVSATYPFSGRFETVAMGKDGSFAVIRDGSDEWASSDAKAENSVELRKPDGSLRTKLILVPKQRIRATCLTSDGDGILLIETPAAKGKAELRIKRSLGNAWSDSATIESIGSLEDACFSADGKRLAILASAANGKTAETVLATLNLTASPKRLDEPIRLPGNPNRVKLSAEGAAALAYSSAQAIGQSPHWFGFVPESEVHLLNLATGSRVEVRHRRPITFADFGPDGSLVVTCSEDRSARVWHAESGKPATPPLEHKEVVHHAVISMRGVVATAGSDHARIWQLSTGEPLTPPLPHPGGALWVSLRSDLRGAVTAGADGSVRLWSLDPSRRDAQERMRMAEWLSSHALSPTGGVVSLTRTQQSNLHDRMIEGK